MNNKLKIKIGVIGVGHLGNFHLEQLSRLKNVSCVGFYDVSKDKANQATQKFNLKSYKTISSICKDADAIIISTPTSSHYDVALQGLEHNCHLFIEKPITETVEQAKDLLEKSHNKIIQVGHIENFNPAFCSLKDQKLEPQFIESHRLSTYNSRGTDVTVVSDLMIHDIGILITIINSKIKHINAKGVNIISNSCDVANARIEFENGCVANLTASRFSNKKMRKMRLFQKNNYTSIDFLNHKIESFTIDKKGSPKLINDETNKKIVSYNALRKELSHFVSCIINNKSPIFDGFLATESLKIAIQIQNKINNE